MEFALPHHGPPYPLPPTTRPPRAPAPVRSRASRRRSTPRADRSPLSRAGLAALAPAATQRNGTPVRRHPIEPSLPAPARLNCQPDATAPPRPLPHALLPTRPVPSVTSSVRLAACVPALLPACPPACLRACLPASNEWASSSATVNRFSNDSIPAYSLAFPGVPSAPANADPWTTTPH